MLYRSLLKLWLLPPVLNIVLVLSGLALMRRCRRLGITLIATGLGSLLLLSLPVVSNGLLAATEVAGALEVDDALTQQAGAIVVLGAGHTDMAPEYAAAWPRRDAQLRLTYAAWLHKKTGLPLLLTGGIPSYSEQAHADVSAHYLAELHGIDASWIENTSRTTWENASNAAAILLPKDIDTIVLVTQSMHMRRGVLLFERAGFKVFAAPTQLAETGQPFTVSKWLPNTGALHDSTMVLHEMLGYVWYRLKG